MKTSMITAAPTWEIGTGKPTLPARLIQGFVYLRNDQPNGFALKFGSEDLHDSSFEASLHKAFDFYVREWDTHPDEHEIILDTYQSQVEEFARRTAAEKEKITAGWSFGLLLNMVWLTWACRVDQDEFNGTQFLWLVDGEIESVWCRGGCGKSAIMPRQGIA